MMSRRHAGENMDFSGLFKVDALSFFKIYSHSFYELGLKKFISIASDQDMVFFFINSDSEKFDKKYSWDFSNPINCQCFEPSGTWLVVVSDQKIVLVPFLPLFTPESTFDCKWSLEGETELSLSSIAKPTVVVWWLSKESNNYLIIGYKNGSIQFFSMETHNIVGESKVSDEVTNLQMCFDDSLDLLTLLITGSKQQQWRLVLEHRSFGYNWLHQMQQADSRPGNFFNYIKQFSKDKITLFTQQSTSADNTKPQTVEYVLKPTEYMPSYRKRSSKWSLTAQYVNGRHFLSAFDLNEGTLHIESPDEDSPSRTFHPVLKKECEYTQGLWSQRLIYLLRKNELEIHSASFAALQGSSTKETTLLWSTELIGTPLFGYVMSAREPHGGVGGWKEPTFLCDLQLPRFALEPCLVITTEGAYMLSTITSPAEWLVSMIMRGAPGCEQSAASVSAPVPVLLRAACDMLLSRDKLAPARYLYSLSQCPPDGWMARLGVFGRLQELSMFGLPIGSTAVLGSRAITIKLMSILMKIANNIEEKFPTDVKFTNLTASELEELSSIAAALGLWDLLPTFNLHRGHPAILLKALKNRRQLCRGALDSLVNERNVALMLLCEESQWLYDFIEDNCGKFDIDLLKRLCVWMCPLQQQFRPVMRDLKLGIQTPYTSKLQCLISTFMRVVAQLERHLPNSEMLLQLPVVSRTINNFVSRRALSCGLAHWAVCEEGNAKIMGADCPVNPELIGRVISVACGRHHTLLLTENGVYAAGDNTYGQLGVGQSWAGAVGEQTSASGTFLHVPFDWPSPIVEIAAGHYHSAAVDCEGRLFVWGWGVHGQLGLGKIDDELTPQLVTKLQDEKVVCAACACCHSASVSARGGVRAWGASALGQAGRGARDKQPAPARVPLPERARTLHAAYFHNLALCESGAVYIWGGSGQSVRAAYARNNAPPSPSPSPSEPLPSTPDPHLSPVRVDLGNLLAPAVAIATGWHHSAIIDKNGNLYTWGLNFDGQLGSGDRKLVAIPTLAKFNREIPSEGDNEQKSIRNVETKDKSMTKAIVACGGDFTVFIDDLGRIYASGNIHQDNQEESKGSNRVFMMKTTKRVLKIPTHNGHNKFVFQPIDRIEIMFPFDVNNLKRTSLDAIQNPIETIEDFGRKTWSDELLLSLFPWIKDETLSDNCNMSRKLAYHSKNYAESLRFSLEDLKKKIPDDVLYFSHTDTSLDKGESSSAKCDNKIAISSIITKRIKELSLSILNDQPYPLMNTEIYKSLPCNCDETIYTNKTNVSKPEVTPESNISLEAANILDRCINMFPTDSKLWETCFKLAKDFFLENELSIDELEIVLRKYTEVNASAMAHAVMFSTDCVQYNKILSPNLYLTMCSKILDTWI